jgi:hypothetical protein
MTLMEALYPVLALAGGLGLAFALLGWLADYLLPALFVALGRGREERS